MPSIPPKPAVEFHDAAFRILIHSYEVISFALYGRSYGSAPANDIVDAAQLNTMGTTFQ